jgi:PurA ssDNA and RNA-binding protein
MGNIIEARELQIERKHFYVELRENERGRFLRITEEAHGRRNSIIVPSTGVEAAVRPNELQLEIAAFQDSRASLFHLIHRATDVAPLHLNSAAAVQDHVRVQAESAGVERAVFDAIVQGEAHQVNVLDAAFLQVMGQAGVTSMRVVKKRAVTIDPRIDALVENVSNSARVE